MPRSFLLLLAACLTVPAASAGWGAHGAREPDTARDAADGWMFLAPDTAGAGARKVYFNGFEGQCAGTCTSLNPNVAHPDAWTAQSTPWYVFLALFGVWKDCNADGYVGFGDHGAIEYRVELLDEDDSARCPAQPVPEEVPLYWFPPHNDGDWVHEYLPLAWSQQNVPDANAWNVDDNASRVWVDYGLPEKSVGSADCWVNPPRGSLQSTGGLLRWLDCGAGYAATDALIALAALDPALAPFSFADHPREQDRSSSALNVANPWGDERDASHAQAWDCSQPALARVDERQQLTESAWANVTVNVSTPAAPPAVSEDGSAAGTANATVAGSDRCGRRTEADGGTGGAAARAPYAAESDVVITTYRQAPDDTLRPDSGERSGVTTVAVDDHTELRVPAPLGRGTPADLGARVGTEGFWTSIASRVVEGPGWDSNHARAQAIVHVTFYGFVSGAAQARHGLQPNPTSKVATYGAEACGTHVSGIRNGWNCDDAAWYRDANGRDIQPRSPFLGHDPASPLACEGADLSSTKADSGCVSIAAFPGSPYNVRDIDCYDMSTKPLRERGVSSGSATGETCA